VEKNLSVYDKLVIKMPEKKRKYGNKRNCYKNFDLKDDLEVEFTTY